MTAEANGSGRVGIVVGSRSDIGAAERAMAVLDELGVDSEIRVISAHGAPDLLARFIAGAEDRGIRVFIAIAGLTDRAAADICRPLDPEPIVDVQDPPALLGLVDHAVERPTRPVDDVLLGPGVALQQRRISAQGVTEAKILGEVAGAAWMNMEVDPILDTVLDDRPDMHRPGRRPRIGAGLRPEPERVHRARDVGNVGWIGLGPEVDDPLPGQARDRCAPDVLDLEVRPGGLDDCDHPRCDIKGARIPRPDGSLAPFVRTDRTRRRVR